MKTALRIAGITLTLAAALNSSVGASYFVTCYYFCIPEGRRTTTVTYEQCCEGAPGNFPCANGSQGSPYGYMSPMGPQFC